MKDEKKEVVVQSVPNWTWMILIAICLLLAIGGGVKSCSDKKEAKQLAAKKYAAAHPPAPQRTVEALVLENECFTPCSVPIAGKFKIRTDGHSVRIKFQGVHDEVVYPAEGDFQAPSQILSGETKFVSNEKEHPNVRVQVYKKIAVPQ